MRRLFAVVGAVALAAALSIPALAYPSSALDLGVRNGGGSGHVQIEKQSWWLDSGTVDPDHRVINSTNCSWDINDYGAVWSRGSFAAGATVSTASCHIWDWNPMYGCKPICADYSAPSNWVGERVTSTGRVAVSVCFDPQSRCFAIPERWDQAIRRYVYQSCIQLVFRPDDPAIVDIAGSGFGRGVYSNTTITITNPATRGTLKEVRVDWGLSSDQQPAPGCEDRSTVIEDYPYRWT